MTNQARENEITQFYVQQRREDLEWSIKQKQAAKIRLYEKIALQSRQNRCQLIVMIIIATLLLTLSQIASSLIKAGIW